MIFCALIVVSQLVRLSNVLAMFGLTLENVLLPFLYIVVPFMPVVIPISFLFAVMVAFSRLSADGETTALLAAGYGLQRTYRPVFVFALVLYGLGMLCATHLEAWGRREFVQFLYRKTQTELDNMVRFKLQPGVFANDFLDYVFYTEAISKDRVHYTNVLMAPEDGRGRSGFVLMAPRATIEGSVEEGSLRMTLFDGFGMAATAAGEQTNTLTFARAEIDLLRVFEQRILGADSKKDDYRSYTMPQLSRYIDELEANPKRYEPEYRRAVYLFHSRFANPFIVLIFSMLGLILGLQDRRHGRNWGYIGAVLTIIGCYVVVVAFRWLAEKGYYPLILGAWTPQLLLGVFGSFLFYQRCRLPLSESLPRLAQSSAGWTAHRSGLAQRSFLTKPRIPH